MKSSTSTFYCLLFFILSGISTNVLAQVPKFGKIEDAELTMKVYDKDTTAAAVILSDYGNTHFIYSSSTGFQLVFERQTRVKILKKSGYEWADIEVPYYQQNSRKEKVANIKGYTYNLVDGKQVKEKLETKAVFDEQMNENWSQKKFTMPNVKEGSVIEYSYIIYSDFLYNMREWEFQTTIPVAWSEYHARIPEYFNYKLLQQGYLPFHTSEKQASQDKFNVSYSGETTGAGFNMTRQPGGTNQVDTRSDAYIWIMKDVPALREEKYITTLSDYQAKLEFELQLVKYPGQAPKVMTGNWEDVTRDLLQSEKFGTQLNRNSFFKNEVAAIVAKYKTPEEQMAAIHGLVKKTVKWDGKNSIYAITPIRKVYDSKTGNAAEINLLMTSMLLEAGLDAAPVLVSTRSHGRVHKGSPMLSKFNYVISHVRIGENEYLLDATDPLLPAGSIPVRCLNGEGRLIKKNDQRWVALTSTSPFRKVFSSNMTINSNGDMTGSGMESAGGYEALSLRRRILEEGEDKYAEKLAKEVGDFKVGKPAIQNLHEIDAPLNITYDITATGNGQQNSVLYLNPMLGRGEKENPFKLEERVYPVDFGAPIDETYVGRFIVPDGYEMEEAPKSVVMALPENGGRFTYMVQKDGNTIQVMSKISINKPMFYAPEYADLKEFYNQIVAKHAEQIVLKKIAGK
ncbi:DUF3857 domain-containing protein [Pontibacter vulgaris]|uniref:DUF3857 domain-containing protein n=1 Tax=Pontibacter vulgaris TaxID=2905679 RepID=UPI001FA6D6B8|nr:DUF3857 domain-containing protein [Pontibacter vulgaris]